MFLNCSVLISCLLALLSPFLWAETSHFDEKIFEMEAQLETIKSELAQTKILAQQERASAFNPSISVIGDIVGQYGIGVPEEPKNGHAKDSHDHSHSHDFQNGVNVRELEFEFRGAIDPWADALVVVAIEQHGLKHFEIDVEEAFVRLKKWPVLDYAPLGIESRLGKFRTAIGRMNRIHLHNIPHISYPLALQVFLGEEGYASQGLSFNSSWVPSSKSALTWFLEGITGSRLPMQDKGAQEVPSGIGHLWWHQELNDAHFIDLGISSLVGRKGKYESGTFWLSGADFHYSYLPTGHGQNPVFLFGSEFYMANKETDKFYMGTGKNVGLEFLWNALRYCSSQR